MWKAANKKQNREGEGEADENHTHNVRRIIDVGDDLER